MTVKVMVSFPDRFLLEVDQIAQVEHRSRSELLREAARLYIELRHSGLNKPHLQQAIAAQDALARLSPGVGEDSTATIRRGRDTGGLLERE